MELRRGRLVSRLRGWLTGVTFRLVAIVMVPVAAVSAWAAPDLFERRATASRAAAIDRGVADLNHLVALAASLRTQQAIAAFDVRFLDLGVTRASATSAST